MHSTFTAVIKEENGWWIGWIEEIPGVNCQEKTREELMKTLSITLKEAIELNKEEALLAAKSGYSEASVQV
jgi:predicted RNase H-like HicB family nuclease